MEHFFFFPFFFTSKQEYIIKFKERLHTKVHRMYIMGIKRIFQTEIEHKNYSLNQVDLT